MNPKMKDFNTLCRLAMSYFKKKLKNRHLVALLSDEFIFRQCRPGKVELKQMNRFYYETCVSVFMNGLLISVCSIDHLINAHRAIIPIKLLYCFVQFDVSS